MLEKTVKLRVSAAELARWKAVAAANEKSVSEWIRGWCNTVCDPPWEKVIVQPAIQHDPRAFEKILYHGLVEAPEKLAAARAAVGPAVPDFVPKLSPKICANCEHKRSRHSGFKGCCQEDNCLCAGFE